MSTALLRAPAGDGDAYACDPVVAAARSLRLAALEGAPVTARLHDDAARVRTRLDGVAARHHVRREVLVVDDSPSALAALVALIAPIGAPVHAVTHDRTAVAALRGLGAEVHVVASYGDAPSLWHRYRCAAVVIDEDLRDGANGPTHSGTDLAGRLPREARVVVVTSHDGARASLADATRAVRAGAVIRTDSGRWMDDLRAQVHAAVDEAAG